jgi:predicted dehydrogenase
LFDVVRRLPQPHNACIFAFRNVCLAHHGSNDQISMTVRIGLIGIGFMGMTHFEGAKALEGGRIAAIATRSQKKLDGDWSDIQGNFGPRGSSRVDLTDVARYADYHELLGDPDIDLVDICLPTDQHESVTIAALQAGKHVLVEKPISIEVDAAQRMLAAARKAGRLLMVAQVLPFFPEFRYVREVIESGRYGRVRSAFFRRVITPPDWSSDMLDFRKLGGWGVDLHIHDNHYIGLVCGVPRAVFSRGLLVEGLVNHVCTQYLYDDAEKNVTSISGGIAASGLKFAHSLEVFLERATIQFDAGTYGSDWVVNRPLTLITSDGEITQPRPEGRPEWCGAFTDELQEAVDAVKADREPPTLSGRLAVEALQLCHAEADSIRNGCIVPVKTH